MTEAEKLILSEICEINENLSLSTTEGNNIFAYKSRFLHVDYQNKLIVIDEPSPETPSAKPLSKNQTVKIFFVSKTSRYLFESRVMEHTMFKIKDKGFYALKIFLPSHLEDGERREYFRIEPQSNPPLAMIFNIFKFDHDKPKIELPDMVDPDRECFEAQILNISGGGIAIKSVKADKVIDLSKGDVIKAKFRLRLDFEEMDIWSEVRYRLNYTDTKTQVWGCQFMLIDENINLKKIRNQILKYVIERQREIMLK